MIVALGRRKGERADFWITLRDFFSFFFYWRLRALGVYVDNDSDGPRFYTRREQYRAWHPRLVFPGFSISYSVER